MKNILFAMLFITANAYAQTPCVEDRAVCNTIFDDLRHAVVKISMPDFGTFTGFLVNHTSSDGRLLVITTLIPFSTSCFADPDDVTAALSSTTFTFNDDFVSCSTTGATAVTTTGATLVATTDRIALLQLNTAPALPELTYLGWDLTTTPTDVACIFQSTNTSVRKGIVTASSDNMSAVGFSLECNESFSEQFGYPLMTKVSEWDANEPTIEGRGAPLILQNLKVRGVYIIGDEVDCDKGPSYFFDLVNSSSSFFSNLRSGSQTNSATIRRAYCIGSENLSGNLNANISYPVSSSIVSTQNIANGYTVRYEAGTYIELNNGFVSGTNFVATIDGCNGSITTIASKTDDAAELSRENLKATSTSDNGLKIYPSILPSASIINIAATQAGQNIGISICDLQGKIVQVALIERLNAHEPYPLLLNSLSSGFYLVKVCNKAIITTQKIIIQ